MSSPILLDWSSRGPDGAARIGPAAPCIHCGRGALLRHPVTGRPCHKVCAEAATEACPPGTGRGVADLFGQAGATRRQPHAGRWAA